MSSESLNIQETAHVSSGSRAGMVFLGAAIIAAAFFAGSTLETETGVDDYLAMFVGGVGAVLASYGFSGKV